MAIETSVVLVAVFRGAEQGRTGKLLLDQVQSERPDEERAGKLSHRDANSACGREKGHWADCLRSSSGNAD